MPQAPACAVRCPTNSNAAATSVPFACPAAYPPSSVRLARRVHDTLEQRSALTLVGGDDEEDDCGVNDAHGLDARLAHLDGPHEL